MKVSLDWLHQYAKPRATVHQVAEKLTMSLNEVEEITSTAGLGEIIVGEVVSLQRHPGADNLWLTEVDIGVGKPRRIVCGAPNLAEGVKVPVARPGATLPGGLKIAKREIRGQVSDGMLCSPRELGVSEDHSGIWLLPADAKTGHPLPKALGWAHDTFELEVLANRPDCLGHLGVAREVAAAYGVSLTEPKLRTPARPRPGCYRVTLRDGDCTRYGLAHLTDLNNGPSPEWLQRRLTAVGQRPINAIVDITNFVMLEYGQPLHALDTAKIDGDQVAVRPAKSGEALTTLDGRRPKLERDLLIADRTKPLAIGGVTGGTAAEVSSDTAAIILECAHFAAARVRRTTRRLGLRTEASARFEKGVAEAMIEPAMRRAIDLLLEICGGRLAQLSFTGRRSRLAGPIACQSAQLNDFLGTNIPVATVKQILSRLGYRVTGLAQRLAVTPPYWRTDVKEAVDLYEDVARTYGYDRIPATLPSAVLGVPTTPPRRALADRLRNLLVAAGLTEIQTHSLVGQALMDRSGFPPDDLVEIANPLSEEHRFMRRSMAPRHLEAVASNMRWRHRLRLFEIGTVFSDQGSKGLPVESTKLLITMAAKGKVDIWRELRGFIDLVKDRLHLSGNIEFRRVDHPRYQVGRHFEIQIGSIKQVGGIAEYRQPETWKASTIDFLSLDLAGLQSNLSADWAVKNPPNFPEIARDLSVYLPDDFSYAKLRQAITAVAGPLLSAVDHPRQFRQGGRRSLTVRLTFQHLERTLTDAEVAAAMQRVTRHLQALKLTVRD